MDYAEIALVRDLEQEPELAAVVCEAMAKLHRGDWDDEYVALVMDPWGSGGLTFGDVYSFLQVHTMIGAGKCVMTQIDIGAPPFGDRKAVANNALLQELPAPFEGRFKGGAGDNDGFIRWSETINANVVVEGVETRTSVPPGQAPLEVGHTKGSTTLMHLRGERRVARWPYRSSLITILHRLTT